MCAEYRILEFENWQHAQELTDFKKLIKLLNVRYFYLFSSLHNDFHVVLHHAVSWIVAF